MGFEIIYRSALLALIIYSIFAFIYSFIKYHIFINRTKRIYKESMDMSIKNNLSVCHINGTLCNQIRTLNFEEFVNFMEDQVKTYGVINLLSSNDLFFNTLENHFISKYCIIIRGIAIIPTTYLDFIYISFYLNSSDTINYYDNDGKKYSDKSEELYKMYSETFIELSKMDEFKNISDVIAIKHSPEFKDKKLIWKNQDTNILYMHGYNNDPISMLAAIMFHYNNAIEQKQISEDINRVINKLTKDTKKSFVMFVEDDVTDAINTVIDSSTALNFVNSKDVKAVEDSWKYNMFASSIWNSHKYNIKLINTLHNKNI